MSSTGKTEDGQTTQYSGAMNEWALVEARLGNMYTQKIHNESIHVCNTYWWVLFSPIQIWRSNETFDRFEELQRVSDGKVNFAGEEYQTCNPQWGIENVIEHGLKCT